MKMTDINELTDAQLVHKELQLQRNLVQARIDKQLGASENMSVFTALRKDIARLRTVQRQREIAQSLTTDSLRNTHRKTFEAEMTVTTVPAEEGGFLQSISGKLSKQD
jgi:ribosomal protein L29